MKRFFMFLLATVLSVALFTACEGPAGKDGATGPAGTKGDAGPAGKDGEGVANCKSCHGTDKMLLAMAQYDLSIHNKGIVYEEEAGRVACGACHSGDGFREAVATGKLDATTKAASKINCYTCHPIHTTWSDADFTTVVNSKIMMRYPANTEFDFKGVGNLCGKCHQARVYTRTTGTHDSISPSGTGSTYSRFGPHYGTPANVFAAKGLVEIPGPEAYPTSNPHQTLAKGCVSCHMNKDAANPAVGGHSFLMPPANLANVSECSTCHTDKTEISGIVKGKLIAKDLAEIRQILIDKNWLDTTQAVTEHGYVVLGEYFKTPDKKKFGMPKEDVDAVLNYLYIAKDRSLGAHNPKYVWAIVKNTLAYLKK